MRKEPWEIALAAHDGGKEAKLKELIDQWQLEAVRHKDAADDGPDNEPGSGEWMLHREAARVFSRCADELALAVYRPQPVTDIDKIAMDAMQKIEVLHTDWPNPQRRARIQIIVTEAIKKARGSI